MPNKKVKKSKPIKDIKSKEIIIKVERLNIFLYI